MNVKLTDSAVLMPLAALLAISNAGCKKNKVPEQQPNLVYVFADQWRYQDLGYTGNRIIKTPNIDQLASESVNFNKAVSTIPVCSPYRACLMTGMYPLSHGVFHNDKPLRSELTTIAETFKKAGYQTGYIGKWHLNGHESGEDIWEKRTEYIPEERRQGFDYWKVAECCHNYNHSFYYTGNDTTKRYWDGYDAIAQTNDAINYIANHTGKQPFCLFLSWGPPHGPYHTAPEKYKKLYDSNDVKLRKNVPKELASKARKTIAGYYAHITALDDCIGKLKDALQEHNIAENTIFVFTSDHGDMLFSHGMQKKQKPWDESIRVPFLLHYPALFGKKGKTIAEPIGSPDIMPTLLELSNISIPESVEGKSYAKDIQSGNSLPDTIKLITCPVPFHQWNYHNNGKEYRGIRTIRYTYVRDINGPWLLYDNLNDPYQLKNICGNPEYKNLQLKLDNLLTNELQKRNDEFLPGKEYMEKWGYSFDNNDAPDSKND